MPELIFNATVPIVSSLNRSLIAEAEDFFKEALQNNLDSGDVESVHVIENKNNTGLLVPVSTSSNKVILQEDPTMFKYLLTFTISQKINVDNETDAYLALTRDISNIFLASASASDNDKSPFLESLQVLQFKAAIFTEQPKFSEYVLRMRTSSPTSYPTLLLFDKGYASAVDLKLDVYYITASVGALLLLTGCVIAFRYYRKTLDAKYRNSVELMPPRNSRKSLDCHDSLAVRASSEQVSLTIFDSNFDSIFTNGDDKNLLHV